MNLLALSLLAVVTGAFLVWIHFKNVKASHGNEGGMISFVFLFLWGVPQILLGITGAVVSLASTAVSPAVWWTFAILYGVSFIGPAYLLGVVVNSRIR